MSQKDMSISFPVGLFKDVCQIIEAARQRVAISVNSELTLMYWHIGERINKEVLHDQRAEYGKAIVSTLSAQLMELGSGFSFVDRQKRMIIDGEDFYLDLLFYHRKLHRLVAIDLKKTKFKAAYKGQMELYLRWLDKYERQPGEESPLGLLLCAAGNDEQIQLLQLGDAGIQVSQYYTELPDKDLLKTQLQKQIAQAKLRLENKKED